MLNYEDDEESPMSDEQMMGNQHSFNESME